MEEPGTIKEIQLENKEITFESNGHIWKFLNIDTKGVATHWCKNCGCLRQYIPEEIEISLANPVGLVKDEPKCKNGY
jgi:hypothetical protein